MDKGHIIKMLTSSSKMTSLFQIFARVSIFCHM